MHLVVIIGALIFLGGLDFIRGFLMKIPWVAWASLSKLMMLGGLFCYACILSFIRSKKYKLKCFDFMKIFDPKKLVFYTFIIEVYILFNSHHIMMNYLPTHLYFG